MLSAAILAVVFLLSNTECSRVVAREDLDEDTYMKVYRCNSVQNNHMHIFTYKFPKASRSQMKMMKARPTQRMIDSDDIDSRILYIGGERVSHSQQFKISEFTYAQCPGTENDPGRLKYLKLLGDTILPGDVSFAFNAELDIDLAAPITAEVEAYKQILGAWIKMPCYKDLGSCTYPDICQQTFYKSPCPADFQRDKIPCTCPAAKGTYKTDNLTVYAGMTDPLVMPSWLTNGLYRGQITLTAEGSRVACYTGSARIEKVIHS